MLRTVMALILLAMLALTSCIAPLPTETESTEMANPASEYCAEQGYELEIRTEAGGEVGYCIFDDGSECEEWAYFRGECTPGESGS